MTSCTATYARQLNGVGTVTNVEPNYPVSQKVQGLTGGAGRDRATFRLTLPGGLAA